jgi:hypothetical protein
MPTKGVAFLHKNATKVVAFLHKNAHLEIALPTVDTLWQLNFEVLGHPPYCSHPAPVDYHVFVPLQDAL